MSDWDDAGQMRAVSQLRDVAESVAAGTGTDGQLAGLLGELPPLAKLSHPIIRHFDESFAGSPDARESITGLKNPHWWKQKTGRWRGAATDHVSVGGDEAWLCAAGIRAAGEKTRDFYQVFMAAIGRGTSFIPTDADRAVQRVTAKLDVTSAWLLQIRTAVLVQVHAAHRHGATNEPIEIPIPSTKLKTSTLATIVVHLDILEEGEDRIVECSVVISPQDHSRQDLLTELAVQARAVLASDADRWRVSPLQNSELLYSADIDQATLDLAARVASGEPVIPDPASNLRIGTVAHYSKKNSLTEATVEGRAVPALCGYWFVPINDFVDLKVCPTCATAHAELS
ncbi:DUF3039 domain-containing protein [Curtobacterium flaccumfaciens pv. flaccumfaciens]|uniref:DUF3039 domain-containing protein n=1 Tax=Curtobacterium flaccumfaciens TaxID=2035 RepID=UPI00217F1453|nr:DUF3039 domain-containing protein [Curtobacterium flaccumfaciens]MCS6552787.1 DUF3039 domain-containing protein [Curtobacterium flaccumfaciens pv. flaccumfaciens]